MQEFTASKCQVNFAAAFGFFLFIMNFVVISYDLKLVKWTQIVMVITAAVAYTGLIILVIIEPTKPLRKMTKEEMEDHEYDRLEIEPDKPNARTIQFFHELNDTES